MTLVLLFVLGCSMTVLILCMFLVFHPDYEDGLLGRIALAAIAIAAAARCLHLIDASATEYARRIDVSNIAIILWAGLALFLSRHVYRFLRGKIDDKKHWRKVDTRGTAGKRIA